MTPFEQELPDNILDAALGMSDLGYAPKDIVAIFPAHRDELLAYLELAADLCATASAFSPSQEKLALALVEAKQEPAPTLRRSRRHLFTLPLAVALTAWLFFLAPKDQSGFPTPEKDLAQLQSDEMRIDDIGHAGQALATQEQADSALDQYLAAASS